MDFESIILKTEGFLELRMLQEAWDALESLPPESKCHPKVYILHLGILVLGEHWAKAEILAESLALQFPANSTVWLAMAKAQVGLGKIEPAKKAAAQFAKLSPNRRLELLNDPQLAPLWE